MSGFKSKFASVVDDIRHKVVEEGWFGRQTTGNITDASTSNLTNDVENATESAHAVEAVSEFYDSTRTDQPTAQDLYGNLPGVADVQPSSIEGYTPNSMTVTEIEVPSVPDHSPEVGLER